MLVVAIDWSGEKRGGSRDIAIAVAERGRLQDIHTGRSRDEVADWLIEKRRELDRDFGAAEMVVGLDFAFSFPEWFLDEAGLSNPPQLWVEIEDRAEYWLTGHAPWPFWGRGATPKRIELDAERAFRTTDREAAARQKTGPKSIFQLVGSGQVGPGSLRGMPILHRLSEAGFSVWPFGEPCWPLVIELYPRLLTGEVNKRSRASREAHLPLFGWQPPERLKEAAATEHAFDAACSALVMNRFLDEIMDLGEEPEPYSVEGKIWAPESPAFESGEPLPPFIAPTLPEGPFIVVYPDHSTDDGPFDPQLASPIETEGLPGAVALNNEGSPRVLRVLRQTGSLLYTADGLRIELVPLPGRDGSGRRYELSD